MKAKRLQDSSIPFIPTKVVIGKEGDDFKVFNGGFEIKGNNVHEGGFGRITNKEGMFLFVHKKTQVLISGVFTNSMPIELSIKKFILKYLNTHWFYDIKGDPYQISVASKSNFGIVNQTHYSKEELAKTMKQLNIKKLFNPSKYRLIIQKRMEYNSQESNDETGEC